MSWTAAATRWSARDDDLFTFLSCFDVVMEAFINIKDMGNGKTSGHLNRVIRFDLIICLVTAEDVLQSTVGFSKCLQKKCNDFVEAVEEAKVTKTVLRGKLHNDEVQTEHF